MEKDKSNPLRLPLKILEFYAKTPEDAQLFSQCRDQPRNYLTREEMFKVFPDGYISHSAFTYQDSPYHLSSRPMPGGRLVYIAIFDDWQQVSRPQTPKTAGPMALYHSCSFPNHSSTTLTLPRSNSLDSMNSLSLTIPALAASIVPSGGGYSPAADAPLSTHSERNRFIEDLLTATESPVPLDRYKALIRLMNALKRRMFDAKIDRQHPADAWASDDAQHLLKHIIMVGECLARFGTADFLQHSNSSRAITAKDYATLLKQYLESYGMILDMNFIAGLPQVIQDEALTVRHLLQTRCEANDLIFTQLVKHVGLESQSGGAVVYNTSTVTAAPVNHVQSNPTSNTNVQATSASQSKAKALNSGIGVWGLLAVGGLLLLKSVLPGGGRRKRYQEEPASVREAGPSSRYGGGYAGPASSERLAIMMLSRCDRELEKAKQNTELLENDWRFGKLRLAAPGAPYPPGYKELDTTACNLDEFLYRMNGADQGYFGPRFAEGAARDQQRQA